MQRIAAWLSDLRVAIVSLFLIALASAVGTAIPQGDAPLRAGASARSHIFQLLLTEPPGLARTRSHPVQLAMPMARWITSTMALQTPPLPAGPDPENWHPWPQNWPSGGNFRSSRSQIARFAICRLLGTAHQWRCFVIDRFADLNRSLDLINSIKLMTESQLSRIDKTVNA